MGNCCGSGESRPKSSIEKYLQEEKLNSLTHFKVLLLGPGESGKSTVLKQLKSIHQIALSSDEIKHYLYTLHNNTMTSMQTFIEATESFGYDWDSDEIKDLALKIKQFEFETISKKIDYEHGEAISKLFQSEAIQKTMQRRNEFWNLEAADYYFENVMRFVEEGYEPTEEDRIMARVRTTGIVTTEFDEGEIHYSVVDVAGQRSERKKWIHCFDDVKCLVFVVNLAGYDRVLFEDLSSNRMKEALNLFQQIANNPIFAEIPIFLYLNKKDLFEKMLQQGISLKKCFPDYEGGEDVQQALEFIKEEFHKRMDEENRKRLYVEYIAARYKKDVKYAWEDMGKKLIEFNKKDIKVARKSKKQ